jgi:hypothetical protein
VKKPYKAFISYSHTDDSELVAAVHSALHQFAKPWYRLRAMLVFRDKTSMSANPALWPAIEHALGQSEWLVFFACPAAAQSEWVRREINWWLTHRSVERLILCVTGGELAWDDSSSDFDWEKTTAVPLSIRGAFPEEPLWVDLRKLRHAPLLSLKNPAFRDAILDIAAPLHGKSKDLLYSDDLREHRRLRAVFVGAAFIVLALVFVAERVDQISRTRKDTITSLELASKAYLVLPTDPELSALLALAGYARRQTGTAEVALRHALAKLAGPPAARLVDTDRTIRAIALSQDGSTVLLATHDGPLSLRRTDNGELVSTLHPAISGDALAIAWSPRKAVAAVDSTGRIYFWPEPRAQGTVLNVSESAKARQLAFAFDGERFAAGYDDGAITLHDANTGQVATRMQAHTTPVSALAFHHGGRVFASGSADGLVRLWSTASGQQLAELKFNGSITALAFNPQGKTVLSSELLAIADALGQLRVADVAPVLQDQVATTLPSIPLQEGEPIVAAQFTGNGKCLLVGTQRGDLALRQINAWQTLAQLSDGSDPIVAAAAGGSSHYVALLANGKGILYDTAICASADDLCALGGKVAKRDLTADERLRFVPGKQASSDDEPLPPGCQVLVDKVLGGRR